MDAPDENQVVIIIENEKTLPLRGRELDLDVSSKVSVFREVEYHIHILEMSCQTGCASHSEGVLASISLLMLS